MKSPDNALAPVLASRDAVCGCGSGKRFNACHGATLQHDRRQIDPVAPEASKAHHLAQLGLAAHRAGDFEIAESRYRECLALHPAHADAMLMLGVLRLAALDFAEASALIETAGTLTRWQTAPYRQNYGLVLSAMIPHFDAAIGAAPPMSIVRLTEQLSASVDQPLATLKTALRNGAGAALDAAQLLHIAARIHALPPQIDIHALRRDGFDLVGYAQSASGLGENVRTLARACAATETPFSVIDIDADGDRHVGDNLLAPMLAPQLVFQRQIICVNPDAMTVVAHHEGSGAFTSTYKIGYWFWELERLPAGWTHMAASMQELWAGSDFVHKALASGVSIPVYTVPPAVQPPTPSRSYTRGEFGLHEDDFVFLFTFSYWSAVDRKNPWALVSAFRSAFPRSMTRAKLVIKTVNSEKLTAQSAALHAFAASDPRIIFIDRELSRDQVAGLQHSCDCYVSLHRSEGFGLGIAECMAIGKPVIATAYSANLDYMNEDNSLLVDYSLVAVKPGEYPDTQAQVWADADIECAARHMRSVFDDAALRTRLGGAAKAYMAQRYSPRAVGALLRDHLNRLNAT